MVRTFPSRLLRLGALSVLCAAPVLSPVTASAQSRSLIPDETLEVALQRQDAMFTRMDLNRDGAITSAEIQASLAQMRNQPRQGGGAPGAGGGMMFMFGGPPGGSSGGGQGERPGQPAPDGGPRTPPDPAQIAERMIQSMDTDGDGQISRAEMRASATQNFQRMDKNGDGVLTEDERPRMRFPGAPGGAGGGQGTTVIVPSGEGGF